MRSRVLIPAFLKRFRRGRHDRGRGFAPLI